MGKYRPMQGKRISTFSSQLSVDPEYWTGPAPGIKHLTSRSAYVSHVICKNSLGVIFSKSRQQVHVK